MNTEKQAMCFKELEWPSINGVEAMSESGDS